MARRSARLQSLPDKEVAFINSLSGPNLHKRASALYSAGWTLASIGDALSPTRTRSTIKSWVDRYPNPSVKDLTDVDVPIPRLRTPEGGYQRLTPVSPGVPPHTEERLRDLAPQARLFRHRMPAGHPYAKANEEMNILVLELRANDVSIADIARAANVTHRAIARRLQTLQQSKVD
jgi:hypothetical protein